MNINLSKFSKIDGDDKHTVLQHPSGHALKIAHKGLSKEVLKQLEDLPVKMAKGGITEPKKASKPSKPSNSTNTMPGSPKMAAHAYTEPQDQGTDVVVAALNRTAPPFGPLGTEPEHHSPPCVNPSCKSYGKPHPNCRCYGGKMGMYGGYAEGGEVEDRNFCDDNRAHFKDCEYYSQAKKMAEGGLPEEMAPMDPSMAPPIEVPQYQNPQAVQAPATAPQASHADLMQQQPKQQDPYGSTSTFGPDAAPLDPDKRTQELLHQEAQKFQADLNNGHIKPKTYHDLYANKSTMGKIGMMFGMMLAGGGSGLSHQPNVMMGMMDKEIERDLEAQKQSAANRQNFLNIAQKGLANQAQTEGQFINNKAASFALANSYANRLALHDFVEKVQSYPEGSKQRKDGEMALMVMSKAIDQKDIDTFSKAGLASATAAALGGGSNTQFLKSGFAGPEAANIGADREEKTIENVPSVAGQQAARPIPQQQREQVQNMNVLRDKAAQLLDFSKKHEGSWNPHTRAKAQQMANELVGFYSSSLGTSMTEGTRHWLDEQIAKKNPTSVIAQELMGSNSKIKEIMESNNMRQSTMLKSLGFRPREEKHSAKSAPKEDTKTVNGVTYKRGKNGEAVPVK